MLGPLRLHYTAFTADVTSKRGAGEHGLVAAPARFREVIRTALASRDSGADGTATDVLVAAAAELMAWVVGDVLAAS